VGSTSLTATSAVALPAGQASYLFFQQWRVLDSDPGGFYDAGTVQINGAATAALPWENGPNETVFNGSGNPIGGQKGFGGDSRGYLGSRLDLSSFAGQSVTPQFTMHTDSSISFLGWAVDDIQVYTCDKVVSGQAKIKGKAVVGKKLKASAKGWGPAGVTFTYQWLRNGKVVKGATGKAYKLKNKDKGKKISVVITGHYGSDSKALKSKSVKVKAKKKHHHHR